jgi:hypothetical protein
MISSITLTGQNDLGHLSVKNAPKNPKGKIRKNLMPSRYHTNQAT